MLGFDIDADRTKQINRGESFIKHIPSSAIAEAVKEKFAATSEFTRLSKPDVILICVPTPLTRHREPDLTYVENTVRAVAERLRPGQLIVLESTTYPGTTEEVVKPILEKTGLRSGVDFFLAFSPEREDPGNVEFGTTSIPKVVGGDGPTALHLAEVFYRSLFARTVPVSSTRMAEAVKLTENIFRAVNIALVNELKLVYEPMGIDVWEVIDAAKTKPFGFMPFYPGQDRGRTSDGVLPAWVRHLHRCRKQAVDAARMPAHVVGRLVSALDQHLGKSLTRSRILLVGLAYKKNVDDMRESPSLKLIELLEQRGGAVDYHDPFIPVIAKTREHAELTGRRSVPLEPAIVSGYDAVLIATDHDNVDYAALVEHAKLVIDTRNACARAGIFGPKIVKA